MSLLQKTRLLLRLYRFSPKKRFGQSFLTDDDLLQRLVFYASVSDLDIVLEVGAGLGFLTRLLAQKCRKVIAVEIDFKLVKILKEQLRDLRNVELIEGDVLKVSIPVFNKVVSTPPYSISSPLLFWLLEKNIDCAVLAFQKEFAERLNAPVDSKDYSRLTVSTYYRADVELLDHVPKELFYPPPDVDSTIVRLKPRKPPFSVANKELFFGLVQTLFTQRNRKVRNSVIPFLQRQGFGREEALEIADSLLFHDKRVRELAPEDFGAIANEITRKRHEKNSL
jgi:16S rRNA (adenine1518-N6/adenine1519-N6)-dimethyltransferase